MASTDDYLVEVRDRDFVRQGQIAYEYLDLKFVEVFRGVGSWELKLPAEHPLLPVLKEKGSGVIITQRSSGRVFSGRMKSCLLSQDAADPKGTWVIKGVDDGVVAQATVVYPDPAQAANAQTSAYWTASGTGEYLMKQLVRRNAGDLALASRKYSWLTAATDLARGSSVPVSLRFDVLGEALAQIGTQTGLGWRFYQSGAGVVFDVYTIADKTGLVRLDIRNGGLESTQLGYSAPSATKVLVLGQGEGAERTVREVTSAGAGTEAGLWGLKWELTKDQRNTDVTAELDAAGAEVLTGSGSTVNSLKVALTDAPGQRLGIDFWIGDKITVAIDGAPAEATVSQVATSISVAGVLQQATVGDPVGFDWDARVTAKVTQHEERLNAVENLIGTSPSESEVDTAIALAIDARVIQGTVSSAWTTGKPDVLLTDGRTVSAFLPARDVDVRPGATVTLNETTPGVWVIVAAKNVGPQFPRWADLALQNSWQNFTSWESNKGMGYPRPQVTRTALGYVEVHGEITAGTTTVGSTVTNLPAGFRPLVRQYFVVQSGSGFAGVVVETNGDVKWTSAPASTDVSFLGIRFNNDPALVWTPVVYATGWLDYGAGEPGVAWAKDAAGRVFLRGQAKSTTGSTTNIFPMPAGARPNAALGIDIHHTLAGTSLNTFRRLDIGVAASSWMVSTGGQTTSDARISLDGLVFLADGFTPDPEYTSPAHFNSVGFLVFSLFSGADYGSGFTGHRVTRLADGTVKFAGLLQSGAANATMVTLPEGFRPSRVMNFPILVNPNVAGAVTIWPDGVVRLTVGSTTFYSLATVQFVAEQ